jgi:hypothetical protein
MMKIKLLDHVVNGYDRKVAKYEEARVTLWEINLY